MKTYHNDIYGEIPEAEGIDDLFSFVINDPPSDSMVWMWRGQADADWPLHSTAYRRLARHKGSVSEDDLRSYEKSLLKRATQRGYRVLDGRELSDLELLARLRHHGAATRLVDATKGWAVALWFAVSRRPNRPGLLIGSHSYDLLGYEGIPEDAAYSDLLDLWGRKSDCAWTWEPPNVTSRIAAQHSQFLASAVTDSRRGSLVLSSGRTLLAAIPPALKPQFQNVLTSVFDIRDLTLFPDLDGFGTAESVLFAPGESHRW